MVICKTFKLEIINTNAKQAYFAKKCSKLTSAALSEIVKRKEKAFRMFYMKLTSFSCHTKVDFVFKGQNNMDRVLF